MFMSVIPILVCLELRVGLYGNVKISNMSLKELMQVHISKDHLSTQWYPGT